MTEFRLVIQTPEREYFNGPAVTVTAPGQSGEFGVLARHMPMISGLKAGAVQVRSPDGSSLWFAVAGGVLSVDRESVVRILTLRIEACPTPESARTAAAALAKDAG